MWSCWFAVLLLCLDSWLFVCFIHCFVVLYLSSSSTCCKRSFLVENLFHYNFRASSCVSSVRGDFAPSSREFLFGVTFVGESVIIDPRTAAEITGCLNKMSRSNRREHKDDGAKLTQNHKPISVSKSFFLSVHFFSWPFLNSGTFCVSSNFFF